MKDVCEKMFTYMNGMLGGEEAKLHPLWNIEVDNSISSNRKILDDLGVAHTSMSVCDHIVFPNGEIVVCDGSGWVIVKPNKSIHNVKAVMEESK